EPSFLAVGTRDKDDTGEIKIWQIDGDAKQGWNVKELVILRDHKKGITCLAFHPSSKNADLLVSGSADRTVKSWDVKAGKEKMSFDGHKDEVRCLAFSWDERAVFSGGKDGLICYHVLADNKATRKFTDLHTGSVETIAVFPTLMGDSEHAERRNAVLSAGADQTVRLWADDSEGRAVKIRMQRLHTATISKLAYSPLNDGLAVTASWDGSVKLYDLRRVRFTLTGHTDAVRAVVIAHD